MVFEYCDHDLGRLLDTMARPFSEAEVKCLMKQVDFQNMQNPDFPTCDSWRKIVMAKLSSSIKDRASSSVLQRTA